VHRRCHDEGKNAAPDFLNPCVGPLVAMAELDPQVSAEPKVRQKHPVPSTERRSRDVAPPRACGGILERTSCSEPHVCPELAGVILRTAGADGRQSAAGPGPTRIAP
jgi:hypothetical protein